MTPAQASGWRAWIFGVCLTAASAQAAEQAAETLARAIREAPGEGALYEIRKTPAQWVREASASELDPLFAILDDRAERIERRDAALALVLSTQRGDVLNGLARRAAVWSALALKCEDHPEATAAELDNARLFSRFAQGVVVHPAVPELNEPDVIRAVVDGMSRGLHMHHPRAYEFVRRLSASNDEKSSLVYMLTARSVGQDLLACPELALLRESELKLLRQRVSSSSEEVTIDDAAVTALAALGDPQGVEAIDQLVKRTASPQIRATLGRILQIGRARHSEEGLLALIRDDSQADWELIELASGWASEMGVAGGSIRAAILDYGEARRARCNRLPVDRQGPCRRGMMHLLGRVKSVAVNAGFLSDSDWPDVAAVDEHAHP